MTSTANTPNFHPLEENTPGQTLALEEQLRSVIICIAGEELSSENGVIRNPATTLYSNVIRYIESDRFNVTFAKEIKQREFAFRPYFILKPMGIETKQALLRYFALDMRDVKKFNEETAKLFDKWKIIKRLLRNEWSVEYCKHVEVEHSGDYDDGEALNVVLEKIVVEKEDYNFSQWMYNVKSKFAKANPEASEEEKQIYEETQYNAKKPSYDVKKTQWKQSMKSLPNDWLAFVLLGSPGKKIATLVVASVDFKELVLLPADKSGRRNMRKALAAGSKLQKNDDNSSSNENMRSTNNNDGEVVNLSGSIKEVIDLTHDSIAIGNELLAFKRKKLEINELATNEKRLKQLYQLYTDNNDIEQAKRTRERLIQCLEQRLNKSDNDDAALLLSPPLAASTKVFNNAHIYDKKKKEKQDTSPLTASVESSDESSSLFSPSTPFQYSTLNPTEISTPVVGQLTQHLSTTGDEESINNSLQESNKRTRTLSYKAIVGRGASSSSSIRK